MTDQVDHSASAQPQLPPAKKGANKRRRREWEDTHEMLAEAYIEFMTDQNNQRRKQPTIKWLAEKTGLGTKTVERHLVDLDRDINMSRRAKKFRLASDLMIKSLMAKGVKGDVHAIEKFLQVVEGINFGSIVKLEGVAPSSGPNLRSLSKEDLATYKALVKKMAGKGAADGAPQPAR